MSCADTMASIPSVTLSMALVVYSKLTLLFTGETNADNVRVTFICHPAYTNYVTTKDVESIDYEDMENWIMPEKSFFDYLFHQQ